MHKPLKDFTVEEMTLSQAHADAAQLEEFWNNSFACLDQLTPEQKKRLEQEALESSATSESQVRQ